MRQLVTLLWLHVFLPLLLSPAAAQVSKPYPEGLLERASKFQKTVPDDLIYTIFFSEMAAREKQADEWARTGHLQSAADLRDRARQVMQVSPEQFSTLKVMALECAAELNALDQQQSELMRALASRPPTNSKPAEMVQLDSRRAAALSRARARMREKLGPEGFTVADYWIYAYISGGLRRIDSRASANAKGAR